MEERLRRVGGDAALRFLEAVVVQAAFPLGLDVAPAEQAERERTVARLALELVAGAGRKEEGDGAEHTAAARLRREPALLAAFFQNVDLLYEHGFAGADAVSLLVMRALEEPMAERDAGLGGPGPQARG
jgi:hypothetical protein